MSDENRIWTQNLNQELTAAHVNALQDNYTMSWELDGSALAPTAPWAGLTIYYGQFACVDTIGGGECTILDSSRDWRNRMLHVSLVQEGAANELPKGAAYDPDGAIGYFENVMYTATDFNADPASGAGTNWEPIANVRIGAVHTVGASGTAQGDLVAWNASAATVWLMFWIEQSPDVS